MIPENIKSEHVLRAIEEADRSGVPVERKSEKYDLMYNKKTYPPKYIVSLANKYANNVELSHLVFGGGNEVNSFLQSLGFTIIKKDQDGQDDSDEKVQQELHDFAPRLRDYLETNYLIKVKKSSGRARLSFPSGTIIHVRGSKVLQDARGFYYLQEKDQKDIIENENRFFVVIFGDPENSFVFPNEAVKAIFSGYPLTLQERKKPKWYFDIRQEKDGSHYLKIHSGEAKDVNIDNYLNKWDQIDDFKTFGLPKNFLDLQRYILTMEMRANYQPIMIRTLLLSGGKANKNSIALQIKELNPERSELDFMNVPVYEVLEKHGIVKKETTDVFVLNTEEEIISEERQQLIALCNWSIDNLDLQLEELVSAFDKNKNLFDPNRVSREEKERIRTKFVNDFPVEKILEMSLDRYVRGKKDPNTGEEDESTFCYRLENELRILSSIKGRGPDKFGIYFGKKTQRYEYNQQMYKSLEEAFNAIKNEINNTIQAGGQFHIDKNWFSLSDKMEGGNHYNIQRLVRSKILSVYYPDDFMQIHTVKHLAPILSALKEEFEDIRDKLFLMQKRVFEIRNRHPIMREWDNYDISYFLWCAIIRRASRIYDDKSLEDSEIEAEEAPMFITAYNGTNLEHSKRNKILGWKNNSRYLSQGALVYVYNTDGHKIESCFKVLSQSINKNPIWQEEKSGSLSNDNGKVLYPYRWDAELICDNLNIDLQTIGEISPFKGNINTRFLPITKNNYPKPLNDPKYLEFRNFLLSKCDSVKNPETDIREEQVAKYLILRTQPGSNWEDREGQEYHYGTNVPRHSQVTPGSYVIFDRNTDGQIEYTGCAKISLVREEDRGRKTPEGRPIVEKVASLDEYKKFDPTIARDAQIQKMIESIPNYNNQHSIRLITKEIFDLITKESFGRDQNQNQKLAHLRGWSSLSSADIEEIIKDVLDRDGLGRLEIDPETVKRIINHLIASKNVILVGPPGTGKTDLARRLLRVLGRKIIGKEEPVEAVASYEWGRYEVIGGNSLSQENGNYIFHYGCVTKAIKEGKFLLIDEFNRADMNKAFGEMFLAVDHGRIELREDEKPIDLTDASNSYATTPFISVPPLFRMICTMNDYDKSILNDLSYGLLRRFAFVDIDIPKDRDVLKETIRQRIKNDLSNLCDDYVLDRHLSEANDIVEKFIDFVYEISHMRKLGVSTMLDVVRYMIAGSVVRNEQNYWKLFNEAMIDYVLPQFDRLDIDTLRLVKQTSLAKFRSIESSESIPEVQPLLTRIEKMLKRLEELSEIFENK